MIEAAAVAHQLSFLAPAKTEPADEEGPRKPGRPKGARNKTKSELREMLAAHGFRQPWQVLTEMAGLASSNLDAVTAAIAQAERLIAWSGGPRPDPSELRDLVLRILKEQRGSAEALLPYVLPKLGGETPAPVVTPIVLPVAPQPSAPGDDARVIEGVAKAEAWANASDYAPPPMPWEVEENQQLGDGDADRPDDEVRTE
ncbi:MAG: hypothetical protein AAF899_06745 [Pseudomonadota bacterium]